MMISFDTNILVYATLSAPLAKTDRARDLLVRGMRTGSSILLLQTLAEFSSVAIRKAGIEVDAVRTTLDAWRAVLPVQGTQMTIFRRRSMRLKSTGWRSGMRCYGARRNGPAFAICLPRTSRMALNWRELDLSIRSKQRTIC
jgi:hypothetical protein